MPLAGSRAEASTADASTGREAAAARRRLPWLAALLAFAPLALLAELLLRRTHHRPLGAVTFAVASLVLWLGLTLLERRVLAPSAEPRPSVGVSRARAVLAWLGAASAALVVLRALV